MKPLVLAWAILLSLWVCSPAGAAQDVSDKRACQVGNPVCVRFVLREMNKRFRKLAKDLRPRRGLGVAVQAHDREIRLDTGQDRLRRARGGRA